LFIVYGTLLPFRFVTDPLFVQNKLSRVTLNPLISPDTGRRVSVPDVAQNVLLFLPFGVFGVLALDRSRTRKPATVLTTAALAVALSVIVEALQLFTIDRTTSFEDVVSSTIGALAGAVVCYPVASRWARSGLASRADALIDLPAFYPMVAVSLLVTATTLAPFDITLDVGNVAAKLHAFRADPWNAGPLGEAVVSTSRYLVFGVTFALWLRQAGVRAAALVAMLAGIAAAGALDVGQWLIVTRTPGLQPASMHVVATIAGALISIGWPYRRSPMFWWGAWTTLTAVGAVLELRAPVASDTMALINRAMEIFLLVASVVYAWYLVQREQASYALR
jgi:VanZ family protein